jgi:hypothetical protein
MHMSERVKGGVYVGGRVKGACITRTVASFEYHVCSVC